MIKEEKNQPQQDSGVKKGSKNSKLDGQKVYDFFLSLDSGNVDQTLTMDETGAQKSKEVRKKS
jgi:hypothetical protein